jgi:hypothetical protein
MKTTFVLGAGVAKLVQCQGYVTDGPGFVCRQGQEVSLLPRKSSPALGSIKPPIKWVGGGGQVSKADET